MSFWSWVKSPVTVPSNWLALRLLNFQAQYNVQHISRSNFTLGLWSDESKPGGRRDWNSLRMNRWDTENDDVVCMQMMQHCFWRVNKNCVNWWLNWISCVWERSYRWQKINDNYFGPDNYRTTNAISWIFPAWCLELFKNVIYSSPWVVGYSHANSITQRLIYIFHPSTQNCFI